MRSHTHNTVTGREEIEAAKEKRRTYFDPFFFIFSC